ncbi:hypothetical protein NFI96_004732 [Prochilodus magdalenae]|nr:hypothetical protein NFI96_004732 [Prochilodus magdalenae]
MIRVSEVTSWTLNSLMNKRGLAGSSLREGSATGVFAGTMAAPTSTLYESLMCRPGVKVECRVHRGIRQGCGFSGFLYSVPIELLLCKIREVISGFRIPNCSTSLSVSAYADDIVAMPSQQSTEEQLQQQIAGQYCEGLQAELEELSRNLGAFFSDRAKGALVRVRFQMLREMDAPSSFFFNLEKKCGESKHMHALYMSDGRLSSDTSEVRGRAVEFYSDLYKAESCDDACVDTLVADLPKLTMGDVDSLELPLTLDELQTAVSQMAPGRAPGIAGLPVEFYKTFWEQIGRDLFLMFDRVYTGWWSAAELQGSGADSVA